LAEYECSSNELPGGDYWALNQQTGISPPEHPVPRPPRVETIHPLRDICTLTECGCSSKQLPGEVWCARSSYTQQSRVKVQGVLRGTSTSNLSGLLF
jgi:hypothetical protein